MIDLRQGEGLRGRRKDIGEDVNPMEGTANLVDAMLVFACGLLLALMTYWNLDLPGLAELSDAREVQDVDDVQVQADSDEDSGYDELGVVYRDPETGKMYLIEEGDGNDEG